MSGIARKYNFQAGQKIQSAQVDEELDQLVAGHNDHDTRIVDIEGGIGSNIYTKVEVNNLFTNAIFGEPPLNGVTLEYLEPKVRIASIGGLMYAYQNFRGF
jgi:hypothetical protein